MPFLTDAAMKQIVADSLKVEIATLPTVWDRIVTGANATAYLDVRGCLLRRGFEATEIDAWDRGAEFQRDLGLYWSLVRGAGLHGYDDRWVGKLDRRKELEDVLVETSGAPQAPSFDPTGIEHGNAMTDGDRFTMADKW